MMMVIEQSGELVQDEGSSLEVPFMLFGDFNEDEFSKYFKPDEAVKMDLRLLEEKNEKDANKSLGDEADENITTNDNHLCKDAPVDGQVSCLDESRADSKFLDENNDGINHRKSMNKAGDAEDFSQENHDSLDNDKEESIERGEVKLAKPKPSTWAALFKTSTPAQNPKAPTIVSVQVDQSTKNESKSKEIEICNKTSVVSAHTDKNAKSLADYLQIVNLHLGNTVLQLRGLINNGNWCYINATLQSLLGCSAFYGLFKSMCPFKQKPTNTSSTPLTYTMIEFVNEFSTLDEKAFNLKGNKIDDLKLGSSFEPKQVYEILSVLKTTLSDSAKQQDAEEFLTFLLNGLHEEFVSLRKLSQSSPKDKLVNGLDHSVVDGNGIEDGDNEQESTSEDWEQVGRNNKTALLRKTSENETLITKLFSGVIRSSVQHSGAKESASLQPFFTIQLDIQAENIWNIKEAFENYFTKESLEGFTSSKTNSEVEASHKTSLEKLPRILILHLKYFIYDKTGGCQKTHKAIEITRELEIPTDVLSPSLKGRVPASHRRYELFAIEFHHGKNAAGGHYTTAVKHGSPIGWVYCNDNIIQKTQFSQIFKHHKEKVPYLLFYERSDGR